jgi:hypothetical protein
MASRVPVGRNAPEEFRDEERLDSIERRGFVCQGLAAGTKSH